MEQTQLVLPRETLRIGHDRLSAVIIVHASSFVEEKQSGDAADTELRVQRLTDLVLLEGNGLPRHSAEVFLEVGGAVVAGAENDLKFLAFGLGVQVSLAQLGSEHSAGRAPVSATESEHGRIRLREVETDDLSLQVGNGNGTFLADKSVTKEFSEISHDNKIVWIPPSQLETKNGASNQSAPTDNKGGGEIDNKGGDDSESERDD